MASEQGSLIAAIGNVPTAIWTMVISGVPGAATTVWAIIQWRANRRDQRMRSDSDAQRQDRDANRADQAAIIENYRKQVAEVKAERDKKVAELLTERGVLREDLFDAEQARDLWQGRTRVWADRAYEWEGYARRLRHLVVNALNVLRIFVTRHGLPDPELDPLPEAPPKLPDTIGDTSA